MSHPPPLRSALFLALGLSCAMGCGSGPSEEDIQHGEAEYQLAVGLLGESNVAGAYEHLTEAIRLDPDNAEAHLLLGNLRLFRSDHTNAEASFREAIAANERLGTSGIPALRSDALNSLGVLYIHEERLDEAVEVLTEAAADPLNHTPHLAWGNLGWARYLRHEYDEALIALDQALRSQPGFCVGWYRLGQVYFDMGEAATGEEGYAHADEALTHAIEVESEECQQLQDAWLLRGRSRMALGRPEDAVADFERCVELDRSTESGRACATLLDADEEEGEDG